MAAAAAAFLLPAGGQDMIRWGARWAVVLLTDGPANASIPDPDDPDDLNLYCPESTWWPQPFCRDASAISRHSLLPGMKYNPNNGYNPQDYDADDFARDMADLVGCPRENPVAGSWCRDSLSYTGGETGERAVIYAIGLGDSVINNVFGAPDAGEKTLRYAAGVGLDGEPNPNHPDYPPDPCVGVPSGESCGNYFFAPAGHDLWPIIDQILERVW